MIGILISRGEHSMSMFEPTACHYMWNLNNQYRETFGWTAIAISWYLINLGV